MRTTLKGKKKTDGAPLTFADMKEIGLGQLCLSPSAFYDMTLTDLLAAMHGAAKKEERGYQQQWAQMRWLASVLLQPHSKKSIKPTDLLKFPWEQPQTKEQQQKANEKEILMLQKIFKNGNP